MPDDAHPGMHSSHGTLHPTSVAGSGILAALTALLAFSACAKDDLLGPDALQGIDGIVLLGPLCPVQSDTDPCPDRPYVARIEVRSLGGTRVTTVRSGEDGRFRVGLRPGGYILDPESGDPFPTAGEQEVEVVEGEYTEVTVAFDTGIR